MDTDRIERVMSRIGTSCSRAGVSSQEVTLVAATKYVSLQSIFEYIKPGHRHIGENRVQEAERKKEGLVALGASQYTYHLLGNLQTNKVRRAVMVFDLIQSLDRERLVVSLDRVAKELKKIQQVLVEVKISSEPTKSGVAKEVLPAFLQMVSSCTSLRICGLMGMASYSSDPEQSRFDFRLLRGLFDKHRSFFSPWSVTKRPVLSMGMSGDFEVAIEEGSNMVRIGTALFGEKV